MYQDNSQSVSGTPRSLVLSSVRAVFPASPVGHVRGLLPRGQSVRLRADSFDGRNPLAGRRFQPLSQCVQAVGDQLRPMSGAAALDVNALPSRQMPMVRLHDGDHVVDRASPERISGGRPGMVGAGLSSSTPAFAQPERRSLLPKRTSAAVDDTEPGAVPGPGGRGQADLAQFTARRHQSGVLTEWRHCAGQAQPGYGPDARVLWAVLRRPAPDLPTPRPRPARRSCLRPRGGCAAPCRNRCRR